MPFLSTYYAWFNSLYSKPRQLDDEELDSGDDEGRNDRLGRDEDMAVDDQQVEEEELTFMDASLPRQAAPEPSDGEVRGNVQFESFPSINTFRSYISSKFPAFSVLSRTLSIPNTSSHPNLIIIPRLHQMAFHHIIQQ